MRDLYCFSYNFILNLPPKIKVHAYPHSKIIGCVKFDAEWNQTDKSW